MSTQRIYISSDRVTVSKPGYDAVNPPAVSYDYLALDSRLGSRQPLEVGLISGIATNRIVPFTTTYPGIPAVDLVIFAGSFVYASGVVMRDANSSTAYNRTNYYLALFTNQFVILDDATFVTSSLLNSGFSGFYVAWQNW